MCIFCTARLRAGDRGDAREVACALSSTGAPYAAEVGTLAAYAFVLGRAPARVGCPRSLRAGERRPRGTALAAIVLRERSRPGGGGAISVAGSVLLGFVARPQALHSCLEVDQSDHRPEVKAR